MNERTHFFIKKYIYITLYSRTGWCFCCVWEMSEDRDRLLYWPNFSLDPALSSRTHLAGVAQPWFAEGHRPQSASWPSLWPFPTNSTATGASLYSFVTPTCFSFFYRLFTQVHLWLTARSRVNIQHQIHWYTQKKCEFNTRWREWRTFWGEINGR